MQPQQKGLSGDIKSEYEYKKSNLVTSFCNLVELLFFCVICSSIVSSTSLEEIQRENNK